MGRNTCIGNCCAGFTMSCTMEERAKSIKAESEGRQTWTDANGKERGILKDEHVTTQFIQDMLIPQGINEDGRQTFSCKHFDAVSKSCTIYESRPGLCRRYPATGCDCDHPGCTFRQ